MEKKVKISALEVVGEATPPNARLNIRTVYRQEEFLLTAAHASMISAGMENEDKEDTGVVLGVDSVIDPWKEDFYRGVLREGPLGASPLIFPYTSANALAARLTIALGLKGQSITIANGPLSFLKALAYGYLLVSCGRVKKALVGAVTEKAAATVTLGAGKGFFLNACVESRWVAGDATLLSSMDESFSFLGRAFDGLSAGQNIKAARDRNGSAVTFSLSI